MDNSSVWLISVLASVDCFYSFEIFLVLAMLGDFFKKLLPGVWPTRDPISVLYFCMQSPCFGSTHGAVPTSVGCGSNGCLILRDFCQAVVCLVCLETRWSMLGCLKGWQVFIWDPLLLKPLSPGGEGLSGFLGCWQPASAVPWVLVTLSNPPFSSYILLLSLILDFIVALAGNE